MSTSAYVSIVRIDGAMLFRYREAEMASSGGATLNIASWRSSNPGATFTLQTSSTVASEMRVIEDIDGELQKIKSRVSVLEENCSDVNIINYGRQAVNPSGKKIVISYR